MTETQELVFAYALLDEATMAAFITDQPGDREAARTAILVQAIILSTPELSNEGRARLFLGEEE